MAKDGRKKCMKERIMNDRNGKEKEKRWSGEPDEKEEVEKMGKMDEKQKKNKEKKKECKSHEEEREKERKNDDAKGLYWIYIMQVVIKEGKEANE